jgi:DNA repair exonuclease SbcCD ATPase subunit
MSTTPKQPAAFAVNNCVINERTGDDRLVGRCWFSLQHDRCPRHGDVSEAMRVFRETGKLTPEPTRAERARHEATIKDGVETAAQKLALERELEQTERTHQEALDAVRKRAERAESRCKEIEQACGEHAEQLLDRAEAAERRCVELENSTRVLTSDMGARCEQAEARVLELEKDHAFEVDLADKAEKRAEAAEKRAEVAEAEAKELKRLLGSEPVKCCPDCNFVHCCCVDEVKP